MEPKFDKQITNPNPVTDPMKRLALPLIAATPFLSALAPHADAAAITTHRPSMNPLRLGAAPLKHHFNYGVAAAPVRANKPPPARVAVSLDSILVGTAQTASGATVNLGSVNMSGGSLNITAWSFSPLGSVISGSLSTGGSSGLVNVSGGSHLFWGQNGDGSVVTNLAITGADLTASQTLTNSSTTMGATINIDSLVVAPPDGGTILVQGDGTATLDKTGVGTLTLTGANTFVGNGDLLSSGVLTIRSAGGLLADDPTLTTLPVLEFSALSGTVIRNGGITLGNGRLGLIGGETIFVRQADGTWQPAIVNGADADLFLNGGQTVDFAPSAAPVPEPGAAMLFALGLLAVSQIRRRTV